jgi:hypothetical protein
VTFEKGQRKDDVAQRYLASFEGEEGVLFIGKAQEKASVFRTEKRTDAQGVKYPWIIRSTAMSNHYYVYILDRDFGPLFIKFCSYFPYPAKLCLNGHEWLKRQLTQREVPFEPLDNGIRSSDEASRVQRIADTLDATKIDAVFRKWLRRLPHPFAPAHRAAGYRYQLSVLQAEFALTQVLDRMLIGEAPLVPHIWREMTALIAVLWVAVTVMVIKKEEPDLRRQFDGDYEAYCRQVPRWIPRLTPLKSEEPLRQRRSFFGPITPALPHGARAFLTPAPPAIMVLSILSTQNSLRKNPHDRHSQRVSTQVRESAGGHGAAQRRRCRSEESTCRNRTFHANFGRRHGPVLHAGARNHDPEPGRV